MTALSVALREGSMAEHRAAEGSDFVTALLAGRVDERGYVAYLGRLRIVYAALEAVGRSLTGDPVAAAVHDPALERLDAIEDDLAFWSGGSRPPVDSPAADAYAARLEASADWGGLYLAHHYTRYLGDLSGGQAFRAALQREFGLGATGLAFFRFDAIDRPKRYKDAYRARLDALGLDAGQRRRAVAEVQVAFGLNQALFAELGAGLGAWERIPAS